MTINELFHRGLSLEKLRSFLEVARSESVTAAAKGQQSRRSLMSRQIGELEQTLGFDLFTRKGRAIEITEAGRELALLIASFLAEFESATNRAAKSKELLRIGAGASVFEALLFPRLVRLENAFPGVVFEFASSSTDHVIEGLRSGEIDLGILRSGLNAPGIAEIPCGLISFTLVGRRDFDSKLPRWSVSEFLNKVPIVTIRGDGRWVDALRRLCAVLEVQPRLSHRVETFGHVRDLIMAGAPGGVLPLPLTNGLDHSSFLVIQDDALSPLTRTLSVAFDSRAGRVRDRLETIAASVAGVVGG